MMMCPQARLRFSAFLDRELDSATDSGVSAHLGSCRFCRRAIEKVKLGALLARKGMYEERRPPDMEMLARIRSAGGKRTE